jgi:2-C-methyl-D-erythritol 2,4-cyclodiphosphate synthase
MLYNSIRQVRKVRIGQSTDIHQLVEDRPLILGGVSIDYPLGCLGHSDGDALLHAIAEAMLGACGLRDLGTHFPDTDPQYKGASSMVLLKKVNEIINQKGYLVHNIDSLIILEKPKLASHLEQMINNISQALGIESFMVNVKATTSEKLGYLGRNEGVMAQAVVLVKEKE